MNCEIKSKYSNKEPHNNISEDVYQGLKLNTDFLINKNTKRNKVLRNVKYDLQREERARRQAGNPEGPSAGPSPQTGGGGALGWAQSLSPPPPRSARWGRWLERPNLSCARTGQ